MSNFLLGFYTGGIVLIIIYNTQWFFQTKKKSYLYYIILQLLLLITILDIAKAYILLQLLLGLGSLVFALLFSKEFFQINKYYKDSAIYLKYFIFLFLLIPLVLYFLGYFTLLSYIPFFFILLPVFIIAYLHKANSVTKKYFLFAWGFFIFSILILDINRIFELKIENIKYLPHLGNAIQALFFSYILSLQLRNERDEAYNVMFHKSRLATIGELLASISHQWRQPLNRIASFIINMHLHISEKYEKEEYLLKKLNDIQSQVEYMSQTIDDFSNFYKQDAQQIEFEISKEIKKAIAIIKPSLRNVNLEINANNEFYLIGLPNQFSQAILSILQNAKEALIERYVKNPLIKISIDNNTLTISDNAGGIPKEIQNKIFEPYFTTKDNLQGTGLGLYMAKIILESNMNLYLSVKNDKQGAVFTIQKI